MDQSQSAKVEQSAKSGKQLKAPLLRSQTHLSSLLKCRQWAMAGAPDDNSNNFFSLLCQKATVINAETKLGQSESRGKDLATSNNNNINIHSADDVNKADNDNMDYANTASGNKQQQQQQQQHSCRVKHYSVCCVEFNYY